MILGKVKDSSTQFYSLSEVEKHNKHDDAWIIINNKIYDISKWNKKHPGGRVILYYKGQDATDAVTAFHPDYKKFEKYLSALYIGELDAPINVSPLIKDFRSLREELVQNGSFKPNYLFYITQMLSILFMELLSLYIFYNYHQHTLAWIVGIALLSLSQIQTGWIQHDFGHLSVFKQKRFNVFAHHFTVGFIKAASQSWWKTRHNRHHAKTNIINKDPDIHNWPYFIFGNNMAKYKFGWKFTEYQPYYWWFLGPPMVSTVVLMIDIVYHVFKENKMIDLFVQFLFMGRWFMSYGLIIGHWNAFLLYFVVRLIESIVFTWVTSMSHLPLEVEYDKNNDWVSMHLYGTQDVEQSMFNDWITGHLNYQVEHHLFPTMPRHNYPLVRSKVKNLLEKHNIEFRIRPLFYAFSDVYGALLTATKQWKKMKEHEN